MESLRRYDVLPWKNIKYYMKQYKFIVGSVVIVSGLVFLFASGVRESSAHHMTLSMLANSETSQLAGKRIQLGGSTVVKGSINWDEYRHRPTFFISDGKRSLRVKYSGNTVLPDTFQDEALVVMEGRYFANNDVFDADVIYAKCPSKYEGKSYEGHIAAIGDPISL